MHGLVRRREVLLYGLAWPVGAYGSWMLGARADSDESGRGRIGFGYVSPDGSLVGADRLSRGDSELLGRHVRVTCEGFTRGKDDSSSAAAGVDVAVVYRIETKSGFEDVPYWVWQERTQPVAASSSPVRFVAPVDEAAGLRFRVQTGDQPAREVSLLPGGLAGTFKLRRGRYVLGISTGSSFGWQGVERIESEARDVPVRLYRRGWLGERPVGFDGLLLSIA